MSGRVESIWVVGVAGEAPARVEEVKAASGRGLEGDRYERGEGTWSQRPGGGRHVTLIEQEAVDAVRREDDIELQPGAHRRNIVTSGVALNHLVEREFTVGDARLVGVRLCEPCDYMAKKAGHPLVKPLLHRGGLRAEVLEGGVIRHGDEIRPC